jgi:glycosyltransferase involved in cell wall biosynthesis
MRPRRVAVVASEILGAPGAGGPATADSLLAIALGRHGHHVELLVAPGRDLSELSPEWQSAHAAAGVVVRPLTDSTSVTPSFLAPAAHVHAALRADPPDVVVADDWRALAHTALRSRQLGMSLPETAFVLYCHGPARVFAAAGRKVPDTVARFGEEVAQRACVELADAVVSPSAWLARWLREHRWPLHEPAKVIQNLWQSTALGEPAWQAPAGMPVRRLAFFGQLREGKGLRVFVDSVRKLDAALLDGLEILFLGHSRRWTERDLAVALGDEVVGRLAGVRVETGLDRTGALDELRRPGTLAVMPSLLENSPYAVAECIEHGVPFVAADVGGTPELVAAEDRGRVLHPPTPDGFASTIEQALRSETGVAPALPAQPNEGSLAAWLDLIEAVEPARRPSAPAPRNLAHSLEQADAEWFVFIGEDDVPDEELLDALVAAQATSGADVVTVGVRTGDLLRLFLGDPGALGLVENQYGVLGLIRRSLLTDDDASDSPWVLFARLAARGARIVSIPTPLAEHAGAPATAAERLAVLEAFETAPPEALVDLPQLSATLAAALERAQEDGAAPAPNRGLLRRAVRLGSSRWRAR